MTQSIIRADCPHDRFVMECFGERLAHMAKSASYSPKSVCALCDYSGYIKVGGLLATDRSQNRSKPECEDYLDLFEQYR